MESPFTIGDEVEILQSLNPISEKKFVQPGDIGKVTTMAFLMPETWLYRVYVEDKEDLFNVMSHHELKHKEIKTRN